MINGIINVYKEEGYTSHDVVAKLRGILKQRKIGHTGTLDPDARGVLPICLGKGTKVSELLLEKEKTYEVILRLGERRDTQDVSGILLERKDTGHLNPERVKEVILSFQGEQYQTPPMYSAIKVGGKKLYELARKGIEVERKPRRVWFYKIEILEMKLPCIKLRVKCSKGTYIRTLCHDIGAVLEVGGCMESLLRSEVGSFLLQDSYTLEEIQKKVEANQLQDILIAIDGMFPSLEKRRVKKEYMKLAINGNPLAETQTVRMEEVAESKEKKIRLYDLEHKFLGIYEKRGKVYYPVKLFLEEDR